jgi:precorrin-2 dehydrogenase/sirohydrochlorin ferrochelatase
MIPLLHDFHSETVLVFGGGTVGARKARRFAREATVVVVSPDFVDADFGGAHLVRARPDAAAARSMITAAAPALVVTATDDTDLNDAIETAAREHGALVNRADEHGTREAGSVVVPATVRDDPVVLALATGGNAPALSRYLRERFETEFEHAGAMADLLAEIREELQAADVPESRRRSAVREIVRSREVWKALDTSRSYAKATATDVLADLQGDTT